MPTYLILSFTAPGDTTGHQHFALAGSEIPRWFGLERDPKDHHCSTSSTGAKLTKPRLQVQGMETPQELHWMWNQHRAALLENRENKPVILNKPSPALQKQPTANSKPCFYRETHTGHSKTAGRMF